MKEKYINPFSDLFNVVDTAEQKGHKKGLAEGIERGRAEGRAEGIAEGELKKQYEIAAQMKAEGLSAPLVAKLTGLSLEEINKL